KAAMVLALAEPALVERLIVVDIAPVRRPPVHAPLVAALQALDLGRVRRRAEADAALKPSVPEAALRAFLLQNLVPRDGGFAWRLNLDAIAAGMEDIAGFPEFPPGTQYRGPTLVLRGARSGYIESQDEATFATLFPDYRLVTIADAGHWVQAEQPERFLAAVVPFLTDVS
ncbi:MAG: alpha/beta fold hydrolase, partial [Stellaceae bacterium]